MSSLRPSSIPVPHTLDVHHVPIHPGGSPAATSDISASTFNNLGNMHSVLVNSANNNPGGNNNNNNLPHSHSHSHTHGHGHSHTTGEMATADISGTPSSPWMLGSTDNIVKGLPPGPTGGGIPVHSSYPPSSLHSNTMLSQSPSMPMSVLPQQLQQQQQQHRHYQYHGHPQSLPHHAHQHQHQHAHQTPTPPDNFHWNGGARSLPHNLPPPPQMIRPMSLGQQQQQPPQQHYDHSHGHSHHSSHHSSHHAQPPQPSPMIQGGGGAAIGLSGEAAGPPDSLNGNSPHHNNNSANNNIMIKNSGSMSNLNDGNSSNNLATNNLAMLSAALHSQKSLYQEKIFHQPSQSVEAVLGAGCEVMGFDIAEVWLRTGPKTHQLTNSHLRPTALEDSLRKQLVDVYYGEKSSERTHRLSPALCKRAKEANDLVWVTAHTPHGAEALRCSISNVRTAVAIPVCHEASNTNLTIIFFSIRRIIMRTTAVEFLVHISLGAAVAAVNSLAEDGLLDRPSAGAAVEPGMGTSPSQGPSNFSRSEHTPSTIDMEGAVSTVRHQQMEKVSITGARLDLQWRILQNVEYLTDGGNSWIHTAVYNGKPVVVKTLKPECQDLALAINEIESELAIHSRLNHPNIVSLLGAGTTSKGVRFVVLERLDGGTLTQMLGYDTRIRDRRRRFWRKKQMSYLDVLRCARSIADAMAHCHEYAIPGSMVLHRDLKPDNIGFSLDGSVKVLDFGLARIVENAAVSSNEVYAMSGETGSLRYMAPEVADALPYNHKADVYSYGIILWELNAGKKPFDGLNRELFYERVVHGGERPPLQKKWPDELKKLMTDCWSADMEVRPTFGEIMQKIDSMLDSEKTGGAGTGTMVKKKVTNTVRRISGMIDRHSTWF